MKPSDINCYKVSLEGDTEARQALRSTFVFTIGKEEDRAYPNSSELELKILGRLTELVYRIGLSDKVRFLRSKGNLFIEYLDPIPEKFTREQIKIYNYSFALVLDDDGDVSFSPLVSVE